MSSVFKHILLLAVVLTATICIPSCSDIGYGFIPEGNHWESQQGEHTRLENLTYRNVFLVYSVGYNDLSTHLQTDIRELIENYDAKNSRDALLVFSHHTARSNDYTSTTSPTLTHIYKDRDENIVKDTLFVMEEGTVIAKAETLNYVLTYVRDNFPASVYGMLLSSHASGWVPYGYIYNPDYYEGKDTSPDIDWMQARRQRTAPKEIGTGDDKPLVKSVGMHLVNFDRGRYPYPYYEAHEIEIEDFAEAIPMKLDYLIFDACLMGCVEVAYQLRGKCDMLIASQAEILADGMDYVSMCSYIFDSKWPDYKGLCQRYYEYYLNKSNSANAVYRSATISLRDCNRMDPLAEICREIFSSCREGLASLEGSEEVQMYFREADRESLQWYYDLEDIAIHAGASESQLSRLRNALDDCVLYKQATEWLLGTTRINHHSGLSMYLPFRDRAYLNDFYKTLDWNIATGSVE